MRITSTSMKKGFSGPSCGIYGIEIDLHMVLDGNDEQEGLMKIWSNENATERDLLKYYMDLMQEESEKPEYSEWKLNNKSGDNHRFIDRTENAFPWMEEENQ